MECIHYCAGGCASPEVALQLAKDLALEILGTPPDAPLLYRWKGFEAAQSYATRGVSIHNMLPNTLSLAQRAKRSTLDPRELARAEAADDGEDVTLATRQTVKCGKVLRHIELPQNKHFLFLSSLLSTPGTSYLDRMFRLDKLQNRYARQLAGLPHPDVNKRVSEDQLVRASLDVITGDAGWEVIGEREMLIR